MSCRTLGIAAFGALGMLGYAQAAHATYLVQDQFTVTINTDPSPNGPVTDVYFARAYTDPTGLANVQLDPLVDLPRDSPGFQVLVQLPAVQVQSGGPSQAATLVGFCDGSVLVGMADGSAPNIVGNASFDFQQTFGMLESDVINALQNGDQNTVSSFLLNAYGAGNLLPAIQPGGAFSGTLVTFSTPAQVGTFGGLQTPEPATLGLLVAPLALLAARRRRR